VISPNKYPENDNWFDAFCTKVAPYHIPSKSEACPVYFSQTSPRHVLTNKFNTTKLNSAIFSRKSIASSPDNIWPALLKRLPLNVLTSLLNIFNTILETNKHPASWSCYTVIPIPKTKSNNSFRPISLSSSLCKILKNIKFVHFFFYPWTTYFFFKLS